MSEDSWAVALSHARKRPDMYQGDMVTGHLTMGIRAPLQLAWEMHGLLDPQRAAVVVSPHQYHVRCNSGPLHPELEELIEWGQCDVLLSEFTQSMRRLREIDREWARRFHGSTHFWAAFDSMLYLAPRGAMAVRTRAGLWCQIYEQGWPRTPPFLVKDIGCSTGLMITAALSQEWCSGLPYTLEAVERVIPTAARPFVQVEWRPEDDVLPECVPDPDCVLYAENLGRWL
jgi:hypothetical protein